jgi:hypothetical protein
MHMTEQIGVFFLTNLTLWQNWCLIWPWRNYFEIWPLSLASTRWSWTCADRWQSRSEPTNLVRREGAPKNLAPNRSIFFCRLSIFFGVDLHNLDGAELRCKDSKIVYRGNK